MKEIEEDESTQDLGPRVLERRLEIREDTLGIDCDLPEGLGDVFRPGFWLCVPLQPV